MKEFTLNKEKAITALLYICHSQGGSIDMYHLLKIIFFADSEHLFAYGRPITGDTMMTMKYGPVPSFCYDEVKPVKFDTRYFSNVEEDIVEALVPANMELLSESDIEFLDSAIRDNVALSFDQLKIKSHTPSYEKTRKTKGRDVSISFIDIAKEDGKVNSEMLNYISSRFAY